MTCGGRATTKGVMMTRRTVVALVVGTLIGTAVAVGCGDDPSDRAAKGSTDPVVQTEPSGAQYYSPDAADRNSAARLKTSADQFAGYPDGHPIASSGVAGIAFEKECGYNGRDVICEDKPVEADDGTGVRVPTVEDGVGAHDDHANQCSGGLNRRCNPTP
jgi:hypothetical protein